MLVAGEILEQSLLRGVEAEEGELFQTGASLWGNGRKELVDIVVH
jgi:hypothetical protein